MGRLVWIFGGIFGAVGLGMLIAAGVVAQSTLAFRASAVRTEGVVVDLEGGTPVVEFADGAGARHRVVGSISSDPPAFQRGETVSVRYAPEDPDDARIDGFLESWFVSTLLGGLGSIFFAIGAGFSIWEIRKRRLRAWLRVNGTRVQATYTGSRLDTSVRINGRHPWRLTAQWQNPVTQAVHTFESDVLFYDPGDFVRRDTVEVLIDPRDPRRHHLDTGFLPKHAG
jgi:hypothetical protein